VRPRIRSQALEPEIRTVVNEASIFRPQREVLGQWNISAATVNKRASRLRTRARNRATQVPGGIKYQGAAFCENVGTNAKRNRVRDANDKTAGHLMDVGLNSRKGGPR